MYRIIDGRGTGKTSRLFLLAKETGVPIICQCPQDMRERAYSYGITGIDFMSYQEAITAGDKSDTAKEVFVDNIEQFSYYILMKNHFKLKGFTVSNED